MFYLFLLDCLGYSNVVDTLFMSYYTNDTRY
jgi:hypothetical protein